MKVLVFLALLTAGMASPAAAQSVGEVRLGAAVTGMELTFGILPDAPTFNIVNLDSIQLDLLLEIPNGEDLPAYLDPRLEIGAIVNLAGRESSAHVGLLWKYMLFDSPFYFETGIGVGVHNGVSTGAVPPRRNLGCPFGVHYTYGIGAEVTDRVTITGRFQHLSHAYFCSGPNDGLNSATLAVGFGF
jgi:lipid A 3-O-deacylase